MTRHQSEGEVHVEAMRLILAEMERREDIPDWTIWQHMLNMLETIFQGIEDQRDDDRDELMHTRKDRDHWRQARDTAIEGGELLMKSNQTLQAEIETLRKELADAQRAVSDAFAEINSVREQLGAANVTILAQKAGNQYLRLLIDKVRAIMNREYNGREFEDIADALNDFDQGTLEPTPCPECERLRAFVQKSRQTIGRTMNYCDVEFLLNALAELDAGTEPTPVTEPLDAEVERLRAFVEIMRGLLTAEYADQRIIAAAIAKLDDAGNSSVTLTSSPTPVAEPLDADGDTCPGK